MTGHRQQLLYILKTLGPGSTSALANRLEVSPAGVRKHLKLLEQGGLVTANDVANGVGRPDQVWRLTQSGHARFPDTHDSLTLDLIGSVRSVFGETGLDRLIAVRETETARRYARKLSNASFARQKVECLARLRSQERYMADATETDDRTWRLSENHCPVCTAARVCQGLCRSELAVFRKVLGKSFAVERDEFLMDGARRLVILAASVISIAWSGITGTLLAGMASGAAGIAGLCVFLLLDQNRASGHILPASSACSALPQPWFQGSSGSTVSLHSCRGPALACSGASSYAGW